jgi:excisionase family DNA binding protein
MEPELLTTRELAALLRVSRSTVSGWARAGLIPFVPTPTGHRRFTRATVLKLLEERTSPAP